MILAPCVVFVLSLPVSKRLKPGLRKAYRILGGLVVFLGGAITFYLASYTGDQGGIAAFFFQIIVILVYAALSLTLVILNWILPERESGKTGS
jgi:hypothetical protein